MKYLVFSFDDGRLDTYTCAMPIMNKYSIRGVINVISDFVNHPHEYCSAIQPPKAMTKEMILEAQKLGYEIACHGNTHQNKVDDIVDNIKEMKNWGIDTKDIGFASPFSYMTENNISQIQSVLDEGLIKYVRSGDQVRREGTVYLFLYVLQCWTGSKHLFFKINQRHIVDVGHCNRFVRGISITRDTTVGQIVYLLEHMPDESAAVLIFHSIFNKSDIQKKQDKWYWDSTKFEQLCKYVYENENLKALTHKEIIGENDV